MYILQNLVSNTPKQFSGDEICNSWIALLLLTILFRINNAWDRPRLYRIKVGLVNAFVANIVPHHDIHALYGLSYLTPINHQSDKGNLLELGISKNKP